MTDFVLSWINWYMNNHSECYLRLDSFFSNQIMHSGAIHRGKWFNGEMKNHYLWCMTPYHFLPVVDCWEVTSYAILPVEWSASNSSFHYSSFSSPNTTRCHYPTECNRSNTWYHLQFCIGTSENPHGQNTKDCHSDRNALMRPECVLHILNCKPIYLGLNIILRTRRRDKYA